MKNIPIGYSILNDQLYILISNIIQLVRVIFMYLRKFVGI